MLRIRTYFLLLRFLKHEVSHVCMNIWDRLQKKLCQSLRKSLECLEALHILVKLLLILSRYRTFLEFLPLIIDALIYHSIAKTHEALGYHAKVLLKHRFYALLYASVHSAVCDSINAVLIKNVLCERRKLTHTISEPVKQKSLLL